MVAYEYSAFDDIVVVEDGVKEQYKMAMASTKRSKFLKYSLSVGCPREYLEIFLGAPRNISIYALATKKQSTVYQVDIGACAGVHARVEVRSPNCCLVVWREVRWHLSSASIV